MRPAGGAGGPEGPSDGRTRGPPSGQSFDEWAFVLALCVSKVPELVKM